MATTITRRVKGKKPEKIVVTEEDQNPGVIYIGHVPHGFYEDQMNSYFSQFGHVLAVKLSRSKKTGRSKGYAFVKFRFAAVAKTVAETCHNYLFFNRLLKCSYRPMSDIHKDTFKAHPETPTHKEKSSHNNDKSNKKLQSSNKKALGKMKKKMKFLSDEGIKFDLDEVVSIPSQQPTSESQVKQTKELKEKNPKGRKRTRNEDTSDGEKIVQNKTKKRSATTSENETIVEPTAKRRKKSLPISPEAKQSTKKPKAEKAKTVVQVQPVKKGESLKEKVPKVKSPGKGKKLGQSSPKKGKGKVVVPVGVKRSHSGKKKK